MAAAFYKLTAALADRLSADTHDDKAHDVDAGAAVVVVVFAYALLMAMFTICVMIAFEFYDNADTL